MVVHAYLSQFIRNTLSLRQAEYETIKQHKIAVEKLCAQLHLDKSVSFLTGSWVKKTYIRPLKDLDCFVVLDTTVYGAMHSDALLNHVIQVFKKQNSNITYEFKAHSVGVHFTSGFSIDVVPAFKHGLLYRIPQVYTNKPRNWTYSNPNVHNALLAEVDNQYKGLVVPLLKILKAWRKNKSVYIKSFHLELLALRVLKDQTIHNLPQALHMFFSTAGVCSEHACLVDPANPKNIVDAYMSDVHRNAFHSALLRAQVLSRSALVCERKDDLKQAIALWKELLGIVQPT